MITLDAGEMAVASMIAAMRNGVARGSQVSNAKIGPQSDYQTDIDGIVAELAFCKWQNVFPELTISPRSGGADCMVAGKSVDVKATRRTNGRLLATLKKAVEDADIYVLAIVADNTVTFPGWVFAKELLNPENIIDLGHGSGYALEQSQLRPFKSLEQHHANA
jgi:hypothetical protein